MSEHPTLLLVAPHLKSGGAARVLCALARGLHEAGYPVHVASLTDKQAVASIPDGIHLHYLGASRALTSAIPLFCLLRTVRPQIVFSSMAHVNLLVLAMRPLFPRTTRVLVRHNAVLAGTEHPRLLRRLYPRADAVICQSHAMADEFIQMFGTSCIVRVVPSPTDLSAIRMHAFNSSPFTGPGPHLLAMGRLSREKGFDLLLESFAAVRAHYPTANLHILGEGSQLSGLRALAYALGLTSHIHFAGQVTDPARWLAHATLFVLPSRHDALPNALLEAAAAGLPVVATPAPGAVPSLLNGDPGAWLADDTSTPALANAILEALHSLKPGHRFPHPWIAAFDAPTSVAQYAELIQGLLAGSLA